MAAICVWGRIRNAILSVHTTTLGHALTRHRQTTEHVRHTGHIDGRHIDDVSMMIRIAFHGRYCMRTRATCDMQYCGV